MCTPAEVVLVTKLQFDILNLYLMIHNMNLISEFNKRKPSRPKNQKIRINYLKNIFKTKK